jgi:hypothetical protein
LKIYADFQSRADLIKNNFLEFLLAQKKLGKKVAAYGAAAKGNTLLNYSGVRTDLLSFICDAAKAKQGKFMPGSHISIFPPERLSNANIDYLVIFPWNIKDEVVSSTRNLISINSRYVTAIPTLEIFS